MEQTYTAGQLLKAANISRALYTQWKARGFIQVEDRVSGTGNPQPYTFKEVFQVALLSELAKLKLPISEITKYGALGVHGFTDSEAWLGIRKYPVIGLEEDKLEEFGWFSNGDLDDPLRGHVLRTNQIPEFVQKFKSVILVSLNDIEARVKAALGVE